MNKYEHSVYLDSEKCTGCTTCLKHCPTEAIRIKNHRAVINPERCIDCGECIRVCPHKAKKAVCSRLDAMDGFKWKIALPAPTLYGQFDNLEDVDSVLDGLYKLGFDDVFEVSAAAELVSAYTRIYLKSADVKKPAISSACPVVLRLIGLRFPSLSDNIIHLLPPMEVAARLARQRALKAHPELSERDIGVCFISPCPAKASYVKNGFADYKSAVDAVVPISDVYFQLISRMTRDGIEPKSHSGMIGIGWASSGGEATALFNNSYLAADGIDNVISVLDQIENGNILPLEFIELNACTGGCVGGVLTMQNPFIAKARLQTTRRYLPVSRNQLTKEEQENLPESYLFDELPEYRPISRLSDSMSESLRMMSEIQSMKDILPGIDCGSCGAPSCRAFAEDVVTCRADMSSCVLMRNKELEELLLFHKEDGCGDSCADNSNDSK